MLEGQHFTAATYPGYAVECSLKAVLLASVPSGEVREVTQRFRGNLGHDFEWLVSQIRRSHSVSVSSEFRRELTMVDHWTTDLRYDPREQIEGEARRFLTSAAILVQWADERC